jgi:hypothetical protein
MAESQSNARLRADAGAPTSGVIHVRTRLTADFTVISNALAQRRGSAVTVGVATYILSLPDGAPVSIAALCEHFTEGEILISRALRELEQAGYLRRRRERGPGGHIRTRTHFHDVPEPLAPSRPQPQPQPQPRPPAAPETTSSTPPPPPFTEADPQAIAVLAALRGVDPRLILSMREAADLAPAVARWLAAGVPPAQITELLAAGLPVPLRARPAGILAYRLREVPLPVPAPAARTAALPMRNCDGCDRAFRSSEPGHCRDCRSAEPLRAAC